MTEATPHDSENGHEHAARPEEREHHPHEPHAYEDRSDDHRAGEDRRADGDRDPRSTRRRPRSERRRSIDSLFELRRSMTGARMQFVADVLTLLADVSESAARDWLDRDDDEDRGGRYFDEFTPRRSRRAERAFSDGLDDLVSRIDRSTEELRRRRD